MRFARTAALAAMLVIAAAVFEGRQNPARLEVNVVQVPLVVTVTDSRGRLISTLAREDFRIFEDGRPQKIDAFARMADLAMSVALLVDTSNSTAMHLSFEREAASNFFSSTLKRGKDRATIVTYDSRPRLLTDFTDDPEQLDRGLKKMYAGGSTAVYDAVHLAAAEKLMDERGERRRIIILIGDGYDNSSDHSLQQALEMTQRADTVIYAISTNRIEGVASNTPKNEKDEGDKALRRMADETGGRLYLPKKLADLGAEFQKIEAEVRSQYLLSFTPAGPFNGAYRRLRVETADKKYTARTRSGYVASN